MLMVREKCDGNLMSKKIRWDREVLSVFPLHIQTRNKGCDFSKKSSQNFNSVNPVKKDNPRITVKKFNQVANLNSTINLKYFTCILIMFQETFIIFFLVRSIITFTTLKWKFFHKLHTYYIYKFTQYVIVFGPTDTNNQTNIFTFYS